MLNPGTYKARAIAYDFGETPQGKEFVALLWEVNFPSGEIGRITQYLHFATPENSEISRRVLVTAGWDGSTADMRGLGRWECEIVVTSETFNNKARNVVRYVNELRPYVAKPLDTARSRAFIDRIIASGTSSPQGERSSGPTEGGGSDEIPF